VDERDLDESVGTQERLGSQGKSTLTDSVRAELAQKFARYMFFTDSTKKPQKQADIVNACFPEYSGKAQFLEVFRAAKPLLSNAFGFEIVGVPVGQNAKAFILRSELENQNDDVLLEQWEEREKKYMGAVLAVLATIAVCLQEDPEGVPEDKLKDRVGHLLDHGNEEFIFTLDQLLERMKKEKYIDRKPGKKDTTGNNEPTSHRYWLGDRTGGEIPSEADRTELHKTDLRKFIWEVAKDEVPPETCR